MKCFESVRAAVGGKLVETHISFDSAIARVGEANGERIPVPSGCFVLPGFIDEHVHGAGGADVMDGTVNALDTMAETLASEGTTRFVATTMTASRKATLCALSAIKSVIERDGDWGAVLGAHLEGPFISAGHKGAQPERYVTRPDIGLFDEFLSTSGGRVMMITLAPEADGADILVKYASSRGIVVSVGHTDARYEDVAKAAGFGASCITHTYNAMRPLHHREAGTVGAALLLDSMSAEVICDLLHVSLPAIKLLARCKPKDRLVLVTDAMRAKAMGDGVSELGGQRVTVRAGEARLSDGTLAGSVLKMNDAVRNMANKVGVGLEQAVACATENPAKNLGIFDKFGSIAVGKHADFAVVDADLNVVMTIRNGNIVFRAV